MPTAASLQALSRCCLGEKGPEGLEGLPWWWRARFSMICSPALRKPCLFCRSHAIRTVLISSLIDLGDCMASKPRTPSLTCVENLVRYGLGIRRFRNGGSTSNADSGREPNSAAAAAAAVAAAASVANGGTGANAAGSKRGGERDLGAGGSVGQCFEQVPSMFFDKAFTLQVRPSSRSGGALFEKRRRRKTRGGKGGTRRDRQRLLWVDLM